LQASPTAHASFACQRGGERRARRGSRGSDASRDCEAAMRHFVAAAVASILCLLPAVATADSPRPHILAGADASARFQLHAGSAACAARSVELRPRLRTPRSLPADTAPHVLHLDGLACRVGTDAADDSSSRSSADARDGALVLRQGGWWWRRARGALVEAPVEAPLGEAATTQQADAIAAVVGQLHAAGGVARYSDWTAGVFPGTLHCGGAHYQTPENAVVIVVRLSAPVALPHAGGELTQGTWLLFAHAPRDRLTQNFVPVVSCFYRATTADNIEHLHAESRRPAALRERALRQTSSSSDSPATPGPSTTAKSGSKHGGSVWAWLGIIPAGIALLIIIAAVVSMYLKSKKPKEEPKAWPSSPTSSRRSNFLGETHGTSIHRLEAAT
jgi:hypothetical protein